MIRIDLEQKIFRRKSGFLNKKVILCDLELSKFSFYGKFASTQCYQNRFINEWV